MTLPVPLPRTFTPGETEVASFFNAIRDALSFVLNKPKVIAYQVTPQSFTNGTGAPLAMDGTFVDNYGAHSNVTNNTRLTAQVPGLCHLKGNAVWASNASGNRTLQLFKNGVAWPYSFSAAPAAGVFNDSGSEVSAYIPMLAGDYVELFPSQNSGGALSTAVITALASSLQMVWESN